MNINLKKPSPNLEDNDEKDSFFDTLKKENESSFLNNLSKRKNKKDSYSYMSLRIKTNVKNDLEKIAKNNDISVSKLLEGILKPILENYKKKNYK